jgi:hypothetical protein
VLADDQIRLQPFMQSDENILWTGHPDRSRIFSSNDLVIVPFSLVWGGFAIFWMAGASSVDPVFALFGVPFVLIGQYFIWGRFLYKRWDRARTLYGLTDQRVVVLHGNTLQSTFVSSWGRSIRRRGLMGRAPSTSAAPRQVWPTGATAALTS